MRKCAHARLRASASDDDDNEERAHACVDERVDVRRRAHMSASARRVVILFATRLLQLRHSASNFKTIIIDVSGCLSVYIDNNNNENKYMLITSNNNIDI